MDVDLIGIQGACARPYRGPEDHGGMVAVSNRWNASVGVDEFETVESIDNTYAHLERCDPATDMVIVEGDDGRIIGYTRVTWWQVEDAERVYAAFAHVDPACPEIHGRLLDAAIARAGEIAATHEVDAPKVLDGWAEEDREPTKSENYRARGFRPETYGAVMVRPDLERVPDHRLPAGLEIRPVDESHMRAIFDADAEAFRDHWGFSEPTEQEYQKFLDFPHRDETLWKIAWDGDEVVGQVKSFIDRAENEHFGRERGWTEFISTARRWRRRGVARALICESLRELRNRGMTEAALGVHTENPNGAFQLYEDLGYRLVTKFTTFRRSV